MKEDYYTNTVKSTQSLVWPLSENIIGLTSKYTASVPLQSVTNKLT